MEQELVSTEWPGYISDLYYQYDWKMISANKQRVVLTNESNLRKRNF